MSQYLEGSKRNEHHDCSELEITQNSAGTSDPLIIQNQELKKEESHRLYSIPNPTCTTMTIQTRENCQGNVKFMHIQKVSITITLVFNKMIKYITLRKSHLP